MMCLGAACVGNHDLDLGEPNLDRWIGESAFPWLCSNCWHKDTGLPLGTRAQEAVVLAHGGRRIGVIGLIEWDWLACCTTVRPETLDYADFVEAGRKLVRPPRTAPPRPAPPRPAPCTLSPYLNIEPQLLSPQL